VLDDDLWAKEGWVMEMTRLERKFGFGAWRGGEPGAWNLDDTILRDVHEVMSNELE